MRDLKAGLYIKSTAELIGSFFEHTTILIVKHNEEGSIGFVINKPFEKSLHELVEFKDRKSTRLNSSHIPLSRMPSSA